MRKNLRHIVVILSLSCFALAGSAKATLMPVAMVTADSSSVSKRLDEKRIQRSFFLSFRNILPFRTSPVENEKLLSNVKVFPNPIADQINLSFRLGNQSSVSIKVMDALGNEVMTLLSQELDAGTQNHSFDTNGKLTNGFYFIRVSAGTETVVKRISVL